MTIQADCTTYQRMFKRPPEGIRTWHFAIIRQQYAAVKTVCAHGDYPTAVKSAIIQAQRLYPDVTKLTVLLP